MKTSCSGARTQAESYIRQAAREDSFLHCVQRVVSSHNKKHFFFGWDIELAPGQQNHYSSSLREVVAACFIYLFAFYSFKFFQNSKSRKHVFFKHITNTTLRSIHQFITATLVGSFYAQQSKVS